MRKTADFAVCTLLSRSPAPSKKKTSAVLGGGTGTTGMGGLHRVEVVMLKAPSRCPLRILRPSG